METLTDIQELPATIQRRTRPVKVIRMHQALMNPYAIQREINNRSLFEFIKFFWREVSEQPFKPNWHIEYLCKELEQIAYRVGDREHKEYDLIINIPPGTTKTITCSIMWPVWCWTKWYWMKFITGSYSGALSLESAEHSRNIIQSELFRKVYPELVLKEDKNTKSNYKLIKFGNAVGPRRRRAELLGGNRYSTSVGGTLTGFHGDILIWDDPVNPTQALSDTERETANRWIDQTASTRKTDKAVSTTVTVMQRLHQDDVTGHILSKQKRNTRHICLPGEINTYRQQVKPPELIRFYKNGLLDPVRMSETVLKDLEADLGQYGYAGQIGQDPTPPKGGMFKVDMFNYRETIPQASEVMATVRYWDKAGTKEQFDGKTKGGAYTVGVKIARLRNDTYLVLDVRRGRWAAEEREKIIKATATADGTEVAVWVEQEPGSGGKESAEATIRNLAGFVINADRPQGDKIFRADPYSVQVNNGNVTLLKGEWNYDFVEEHRFFPFGTYKDQVDAGAGGFNKLAGKRIARVVR